MTKDEAVDAIGRSPLGQSADTLSAMLSPALRLESYGDGAEPSSSFLGGEPWLPSDFAWPRWSWRGYLEEALARDRRIAATSERASQFQEMFLRRREAQLATADVPLTCIAQIDLSQIPPRLHDDALPRRGTLWFFYEVEEQPWGFDPLARGAWRVLYSPSGATTSDLRPPPADHPVGLRLPRQDLRFTIRWTLPPEPPPDVLGECRASYNDYLALAAILRGDEPVHQLLGWPDEVQGDVRERAQLVANGVYCGDLRWKSDPRARQLLADSSSWRLLLQVDTDTNRGLMWGDNGMIYFVIRDADLRRLDFDRCWFDLQSC